MTRLQVLGWVGLLLLAGGGGVGYLLTSMPPRQSDGQLNTPLVALFFLALLLLLTGLGAGVALLLQQRWPALGGAKRYKAPQPGFALRQGFLLACAVLANLLLALFRMFDIVFVLVLLLLAGLIETYLQSRRVGF